ncbi:MAG TPA: hypothetical protein DCY59_11275 [Micrococcaceae bacterium]|nr:hypothetical protein [Micrococcaceae bacterium]
MTESARDYLKKHQPEPDLSWLDLPEPKDVARPVWVTTAPWPIGKTMGEQAAALKLLFGDGLVTRNAYGKFIAYTPGEICECGTCSIELQRVIKSTPGMTFADIMNGPLNRMILCPGCGNKRCPRASNHDNECTKSNEAGQPGSDYR